MNIKELIKILSKAKKKFPDADVRIVLNHSSEQPVLIPLEYVSYAYTNDVDKSKLSYLDIRQPEEDGFNKPIIVLYNKDVINE